MSYEVGTKLEPDYPSGNWTVVLRLAGIGNSPIAAGDSDFLRFVMPPRDFGALAQKRAQERDDDSGAVFFRYDGDEDVKGELVVNSCVRAALNGVKILGLEVEIEAHMDATDQVSPVRPLHDTFFSYMPIDVTQVARDAQELYKDAKVRLHTTESEHLLGQ